jgi:exosortase/archaeosortase family protein
MKSKNNKQAYRFLGIFIGIIFFYYGLIAVTGTDFLQPYLNGSAWLASGIIGLFSEGVSSSGQFINGAGRSMALSYGCDGTDQFIVFIAALIAYPAKWKKKAAGLLLGILLLYFLNIIRIIGLFYIFGESSSSFDLFHETVFPIMFIAVSLVMWFAWIKWPANKLAF